MNEQTLAEMREMMAQMQNRLSRAEEETQQENAGIVVRLMVDGNQVDARMPRKLAEAMVQLFNNYPLD